MDAGDLTNPQSWNRYAYVLGNPLTLIDPLGLGDEAPCEADTCITVTADAPADVATIGFGAELERIPLPGTVVPPRIVVPGEVVTVTATISNDDPMHCAAAIAHGTSLASKARLQGDNMMSKGGQLVLDNTFTGIVDFYDTAKTATNAAPVYWSLFMNGARLGVPGGGAISQGFLGTTQEAVLKAAFANAGRLAAAQAARTVGNVKVGFDFLAFSYALFQCTF